MADKPKNAGKPASETVNWPPCQLMLVVEPGPGAPLRLAAALRASDVTAVLIRPRQGDRLGAGEVKPLVALARDHGAVALLYDDAVLAKTVRADGVHIAADPTSDLVPLGDVRPRVAAARALLGPDANIGVDAGVSRHRAMEAGEADAEYVAFGAADNSAASRQQRDDLVAWWAGIFEVPCVALDIHSVAEVERAEQDGADFVALTLKSDANDAEIAELVGAAGRYLRQAPVTETRS